MKPKKPYFYALTFIAIVASIAGCNQSASTRGNDEIVVRDETKKQKIESAEPTQTDVTKMSREANLKFRVRDVIKTTGILEKMAVTHGGYVARSFYDIDESESLIKKVSTDSALEIKKLEQYNHLEVFVLNTKLDSFLDRIKPLVDHLNYRHISANDAEMEESHPVETPPMDASVVQPSPNAKHFDMQKVKVLKNKFARVTMDIYQTPVVKKWTIPNPDSFEVARGGFWEDFVSSLKSGGRGMIVVFNGFVALWPLFLLIFGVMVYSRRKTGSWNPRLLFRRK